MDSHECLFLLAINKEGLIIYIVCRGYALLTTIQRQKINSYYKLVLLLLVIRFSLLYVHMGLRKFVMSLKLSLGFAFLHRLVPIGENVQMPIDCHFAVVYA